MMESNLNSGQAIVVDGNIPVLPPGIPRLLQVLMDDSIDFRTMARQLEQFPSIAARLISVANSAWAAPAVPVVSLLDACTRLGLSVVRGLAIALSVASPFNTYRCPQFDPQVFWTCALLTADGAEMFARFTSQDRDGQILRTAGLLHHLGLLWLADRYPLQTGQALAARAEAPNASLSLLLQDRMDTDYCRIGGRLALVWGLPDPLVHVMRFHRDPDYSGRHQPLVRVVGCAAQLVNRLHTRPEADTDIEVKCGQPLDPGHCQSVFAGLQQRLEHTLEMARSVFGDHG